MHRVIRDHLEELLRVEDVIRVKEAQVDDPIQVHLRDCAECSDEIAAMREHAVKLRELRADVEPRPGFYARVRERIEAQGATSIWNVFFESPFGRRIAVASMALALALGVYLVSSEPGTESSASNSTVQFVVGEDQPGASVTQTGMPDRDSVLVNLVTYREQ